MDSTPDSRTSPFRSNHFRTLQAVILIGLILSIVGGTSSFSSNGTYTVKPLSKAGIILYIVAYAAEVFIAVHTFMLSQTVKSDNGLLLAVLAALPFVLVRLIYSALGVIAHLHTFSSYNGSVAIFAVMAVLTEILVISFYLLAGWNAPVRIDQSAQTLSEYPLIPAARGDGRMP